MRMNWELPADAANVPLCRRFLRVMLEHNCVAVADVDDLEVVLGELCANVIRHAYDTQGGCLSVEIALDGDLFEVAVRDTGRGFDPSQLCADRPFSPDGGMGMYLIETFSSSVQISSAAALGSEVKAFRRLSRHKESPDSHVAVVQPVC
jgi:serine/threonine-protein kinase RsbW